MTRFPINNSSVKVNSPQDRTRARYQGKSGDFIECHKLS